MSHRIESRIISRLAAARLKGVEAFRSSVVRAVDYALTVHDRHLQVLPEPLCVATYLVCVADDLDKEVSIPQLLVTVLLTFKHPSREF